MTDRKLTVEEAEARLAQLEKPGHDVALANTALRWAESRGDTAAIKEALDVYRAAVAAQDAAGVTKAKVDRAAQDVLDARGETHSELNVLPSDHGIMTVLAGRALALARGDANPAKIAQAEQELAEAIAADAKEKAAHVAASHARTLAGAEEGEL